WAKQGVLLLNSALTVEKGKSLSHSATAQNPNGIGWERFIKRVIMELMKDQTHKVFVLWGSVAKKLFEHVKQVYDSKKVSDLEKDMFPSDFPHLILTAPHP